MKTMMLIRAATVRERVNVWMLAALVACVWTGAAAHGRSDPQETAHRLASDGGGDLRESPGGVILNDTQQEAPEMSALLLGGMMRQEARAAAASAGFPPSPPNGEPVSSSQTDGGAGLQRGPEQRYVIALLAPLEGYVRSYATGINNDGVVVGSSADGAGRWTATRWIEGAAESLGSLQGWGNVVPLDISNDSARIVGEAFKPSSGRWVPFIWENGVLAELPTPDVDNAGGWQINNAGVIVGRGFDDASVYACRWENDGKEWVFSLLAPVQGDPLSIAWGVNNHGVAAGGSGTIDEGWQIRACSWDDNGRPNILFGFENTYGDAAGINDLGQYAGDFLTDEGKWHAMYHDGSGFIDLGLPPGSPYPNSYGHRINNSETIVGQAYADGVDPTGFPNVLKRAFIWRDGVMSAVNDLVPPNSGWDVKQLWDINEAGQAVGLGLYRGQWRACLLTPDCGLDARLKAKCKRGGATVLGTLKKTTPDTPVTFTLDGRDAVERTTNNKGKAKVKYARQAPGTHTLRACALKAGC